MRWLRTGNLKGIGYWTWKSVIIRETARKFPKSLIHYVDAGHVFLSSSSTRKKLHGWFAEAFDLGGLAWSLPGHQEIEWTKRETLFRLDPQLKLKCTDQIEGGFVLIPSGTALEFSNELRQIHLEQDGFFLTDEQFEAPFLEFKSHRHDQSIHSLVWKSMGLHSRETETSPPGPCDTMLAARHASGYPYSEKKQPIKQKMEFFLGKLHKAFLIFYGRAFSALNQAD
jgi:hypothetical protein